ncbi:MAG: hypothetical protein CMP61_07830 [Flavobacteriales bacterium]|nr:hypothetical protein [Flavobacteriales bacterium]|tara:strand:- start:23584 stop:24249 length:666 start_codon:yes stop_codon:yes gene_type:complete
MKKIILLTILTTSFLSGISCSCLPDQPTGFYENLTNQSSTCVVVFDYVDYTSDPNEPQIGYFKIINALNNMGDYSNGDSIIVYGGASHLCQSNVDFAQNDTLILNLNGVSYTPQLSNCITSYLQVQNGVNNGESIDEITSRINLNIVNTFELNQNNVIQLYPNPATNNITLGKPANVKISDLLGNQVGNYTNVSTVDITGYSKGLYIIKFDDGTSQRFVKK